MPPRSALSNTFTSISLTVCTVDRVDNAARLVRKVDACFFAQAECVDIFAKNVVTHGVRDKRDSKIQRLVQHLLYGNDTSRLSVVVAYFLAALFDASFVVVSRLWSDGAHVDTGGLLRRIGLQNATQRLFKTGLHLRLDGSDDASFV